MDLWIRSQDRETLAKFSQFDIDKNVSDEWIITGSNGLWISNQYFNDKTIISVSELGVYKSKERALEVLDEIQKFLQPDFKCDGYETETGNGYYNMIKLHFSEPNIFHKRIYEMPKE